MPFFWVSFTRYAFPYRSRRGEKQSSIPKRLQLCFETPNDYTGDRHVRSRLLRASTEDQDAARARKALRAFAAEHGTRIAVTYVENASGTLLERRELLRLLADVEPGDVLLEEAVDRLSRLDRATWDQLRDRIAQAGLQVVSLDLPLTHSLLRPAASSGDSAREWMTRAVSQMFLEFMAAFARKDYETRRAWAAKG